MKIHKLFSAALIAITLTLSACATTPTLSHTASHPDDEDGRMTNRFYRPSGRDIRHAL